MGALWNLVVLRIFDLTSASNKAKFVTRSLFLQCTHSDSDSNT